MKSSKNLSQLSCSVAVEIRKYDIFLENMMSINLEENASKYGFII